jgi:flagellar biosynthesis/type III secretory pathway protein FliH
MNGHADGFREGYAEAMDTLEKQLNYLLEQLAPLVSALGERQAAANDRAQANMARILQVVMDRLMPVYVREHGHEEALAVVSDCLGELQDPGRLTIHLSEETADLLGDRLSKAARKAGFEGQIRLLTDEEMGPSDVKVDWGAGGAERRYETIREEIDAAVGRAVERIEASIDGDPETELDSRTETAASDPAEDGGNRIAELPAEEAAGGAETDEGTVASDPRTES